MNDIFLENNTSSLCIDSGTSFDTIISAYYSSVINYYVICYIVSGQGYLSVDGKSFSAGAGQSFLLFPFSNVSLKPDIENSWDIR